MPWEIPEDFDPGFVAEADDLIFDDEVEGGEPLGDDPELFDADPGDIAEVGDDDPDADEEEDEFYNY